MIEKMWMSEVVVCPPVRANFVRLCVAANPSLWQTTPQCHFGYGVYRILHDQPLAPFLTHEVCNPSRMFNLLTLPWGRPRREAGRLWPLSPGLRTSLLPEMHAWVGTPEHHRAYVS
jgi:hypothetical protein